MAKSDRGPSPAAPCADMSGGGGKTTKQARWQYIYLTKLKTGLWVFADMRRAISKVKNILQRLDSIKFQGLLFQKLVNFTSSIKQALIHP